MQSGDLVEEGGTGRAAGPLGEAVNVLVLSDGMDPDARASYYERLLPDDPSDLNVLAIQYTRGPDGWLDEWRRHVGAPPAKTAIVSVNDGTRGAAAAGTGGSAVYRGDGAGSTVSLVESPDDLTGLGITVGNHLKQWEGEARTLVTLDSLTVLLQYVDLKRAFRFLHVMVNRVKSAGAVGHYHMDPGAHDDQTVATLASVFDAVARFEDGEWRITAR